MYKKITVLSLLLALLPAGTLLSASGQAPSGGKYGYLPEEAAGGGLFRSIRQIYSRYPYLDPDYRFNRFIKAADWQYQRIALHGHKSGDTSAQWLQAAHRIERHPDWKRWYLLSESTFTRSSAGITSAGLSMDMVFRNLSLVFDGRLLRRDGHNNPMRLYSTLLNFDLFSAGGVELEWGWGVGRFRDSVLPVSRDGSELRVNRYHLRILPGKPLVFDFYYTRWKYLDSGWAADNFSDGGGMVFRSLRLRIGLIIPAGRSALDAGIGFEQFGWLDSSSGKFDSGNGLTLSIRWWY